VKLHAEQLSDQKGSGKIAAKYRAPFPRDQSVNMAVRTVFAAMAEGRHLWPCWLPGRRLF